VREGLTRPLWLTAVVLAFCVPLFVGLGRTDMENDEAIYSYAVAGILKTGDWLNPLSSPHESAIFLEKPPLKFWIVAAPMALGLVSPTETGMRIWDALFGAMAFLYVFAFGRRLAGSLCGFIAVLVLFAYGPLLFDHGLRNNNMEAPLVLCYCGGVSHYLAWATSQSRRRRIAHVAAVALYFFLGFMTKFVAALFLPLVLVGATLVHRETRQRLAGDWKLWAAASLLFLVLAAPWFIYQQLRVGNELWQVILNAHVFQRMTVSIDPSHVKPWHYYFSTIYRELQHSGSAWLTIIGGVLLVAHAIRHRSLESVLAVAWFVLPLGVMSLGTSKLHHYAYPFLPPIALAAGYGPALVLQKGRAHVERVMIWIQHRIDRWGWLGTGVRRVMLVAAAISLAVAAATLVAGQLDITVGETRLFRNSHVGRPLMVTMILATLAGRGVLAARVLLPVALLLAILPARAYEDRLKRTLLKDAPMRTASECMLRVRQAEYEAHRPAPGIHVINEQKWMLHSHYYYFRHLGRWDRSPVVVDEIVEQGLFKPGYERPILLGDADYQAFKAKHAAALADLPMVRLRDALLLMPGPYAVCGPRPRVAQSQE
jgi:4-amino-4-deoxy-L-arabinose transferase-like glycosyltransferase